MRLLLVTHHGLADALELELKKLGSEPIDIGDGHCIIEGDEQAIADIMYAVQTATYAIALLSDFKLVKFTDFDSAFSDSIKKIDFTPWLDGPHYLIRCTRIGEHDFGSPDICEAAKGILADSKMPSGECDPITFRFYIEGAHCFFGVDIAGTDMSKRDYRIFRHPSSVKGTVAATLLALTDAKGTIVDPSCKDGTVCIESAYWTGKSALRRFNYEQLCLGKPFKGVKPNGPTSQSSSIVGMDSSNHNISSTRKNIQIAGLKDDIKIFKEELDWLSTRLQSGSVARILSVMPSPTHRMPEKPARRLYTEFLENAKDILSEDGLIGLVMADPTMLIELASVHRLKLSLDREFDMGKQPAHIIILKK